MPVLLRNWTTAMHFCMAFLSIRSSASNTYLIPQQDLFSTLSGKYEHITPVLMKFHWLPVEKSIEFKILLYMYKVVNGMAPTYLEERLDLYRPGRSLRSENTEL